MASFGSRSVSAHGRLHKRGNSGSSTKSPSLPPAPEYYPSTYKASNEFKRVAYSDEVLGEEQFRGPNSIKIKPYLRKLSSKDDNRIDLSRTAEENEKIAGFGMGEYGAKSVSEVSFTPLSRSRHARTTSNNSQFSTTSSLQRPSAPYAHPMRHTPRPYTPPIAKSYSTSVMSEGIDADPSDLIMTDEYRTRGFEAHNRSGSLGSLPAQPPPLHIHTSNSFTRLNSSQSSIPSSLPTGGRSRGDTLRSMDTLSSPSGRTSIEKSVSFIHRGKSISTDELDAAASRAASIRALRAAYNEKEETKNRKLENKLANKKVKKEERLRRKSESDARATARKNSDVARVRADSNNSNEKEEFVAGKSYSDLNATHARALPSTGPARPRAATNTSGGSSKRDAKSSWLAFLAWFRTRVLRLSRKLHVSR